MQAALEFIKSIAEGVFVFLDFLSGIIEDLVYMVTILGQFLLDIPSYLSWLPSGIVAIFITVFSIVVTYKVLGREG